MYAALTERLSAWQQAADVWTARSFGFAISGEDWKAVRAMTAKKMISPKLQKLVAQAQQIAAQQRFFHWELAFPEIFFDAEGKPLDTPGFDAVIGNPPYVRQERIQPIKPFLQSHYEIYSGTADLFLYFYERGLQFLKRDHRLGFITSGTYMNSNSAKPFREFIHQKSGLEWVANFGENQPFRGAEMVYPTIAILRSGQAKETFRNLFIEGNIPYSELQLALERGAWIDSLSESTGVEEWRFQPAALTRLFKKITTGHQNFNTATHNRIYNGLKTGLNEVFVIGEEKRKKLIEQHSSSAEIIKPMLRGEDLRPYYHIATDDYLILATPGINIEAYPAIYN